MSEAGLHPKSLEQLQLEQLHNAVSAADTVTVEFGTGYMPLFEAGGSTWFDRDNLYVGVNIDSRQHKHLAEHVGAVGGFAVLAEREEATGAPQVPLLGASVDTVFLGEVFGEPDSPHIMSAFRQADGQYHGRSTLGAKQATLHEAARLLRPDGRLVVLETNTPFGIRPGQRSYHTMTTILESNGFDVQAAHSMADDTWSERVAEFAAPQQGWSRLGYMLVAHKRPGA